MPEPRANAPDPEGAPAPGKELPAPTDDDDLLGGHVPPTDDSPTVVSKSPPQPVAAPPAVFSGGLRGRKLAHFELIEAVGVGGMAAVIRARDSQLDRPVALKILPPEMAQDPENVRRFHQEARSAAKLDHENIARVFFCGEDQRLHFIAFEFVEGENLRTLIERRGRLPFAEAAHYVLQVAAGLAHAAGRGVVHRDIKPSNILVTPDGQAKLVDMGLARSLEPQHDNGLTQSGVTLGTFDYISPEQALEPRDADVRSDIYSLGCTFYHMVTGQPPVPEGTAARKLHHHQQVRPLDPRELAPDLPDGAAVVIGRMIAKQPEDRYQSPEELVQGLLHAAREAGAAAEPPPGLPPPAEVPPAPPRGRPLALAALAALAVVGLVLLLDPSGTPTPAPGPAAPDDGGRAQAPAGPGPAPGPGPEKAPVRPAPGTGRPAAVPGEARLVLDALTTPEQLAEWAAANKGRPLVVEVAADRELNVGPSGDNPGFVLRGPKVTVRPRDPRARPTVSLAASAGLQGEGVVWAGLTVEADEAVVEGLRFVVDAQGARVAMAGLRLRGGRAHRVRDCEFVQVMPPLDGPKRVASVLAEAGPGPPPRLSLKECCFLGAMELVDPGSPGRRLADFTPRKTERGGRDAVARRGPVRLAADSCAFGPHAADFRLEGAGPAGARPAVAVRHCSVLAGAGSAVFQLPAGADAALEVEACLFSRPPAAGEPGGMMATSMSDADRGAVLVRQEGAGGLTFVGQDNRYHNLDAFWAAENGEGDGGVYDDFRQKVVQAGGRDDNSRVLADSGPWKSAEPLKALEQARPALAFRADDRSPDLRLAGDRSRLVGAAAVTRETLAASHLPDPQLTRPGRAPARTLVVDPAGAAGTYQSLEKALPNANPGDVIEVRHRGPLRVTPQALPSRLDLTVRAAPGSRPELTLGDSEEAAPALFKLYDGNLRLEGLGFRLRPADDYRSQAVVALLGDGRCEFKNCTVTLEPNGRKTALAAASLPETAGTMMRGDAEPASGRARGQGPLLVFQGCLLRGEGDAVRGRGRPFELNARDTVAVLTGSLLNVEAAADPSATAGPLAATLEKVTTFLTGHLLRLQGGKGLKGLPPVQWAATDCLFVAARGRSLIRVEGAGADEDLLREKLGWTGSHNAYRNLRDPMVDQEPPGGGASVARDRWEQFADEAKSNLDAAAVRFAAPRFAAPAPSPAAYLEAQRSDLKPADPLLLDYGATLGTPAAGEAAFPSPRPPG